MNAIDDQQAQHAPRDSARIFFSGHSLLGEPLPDDLAAIAASLGQAARWNQQYLTGSTIRSRTCGAHPGHGAWAGYRTGQNRDGEGMDVLRELREPQALGGDRYDTLVITEQHGLLASLVWDDTVRCLRHFHERFIEGNPQGRTWFYASWLDLDDKNDPRRWIAYERSAAFVWQAVVTRINTSLAGEGRRDRLRVLPASTALATLVERATQGSGLAGVSASSVRETVDRIVADTVHLTRMGNYYMALVVYAALYGRSPIGAWAPDDLEPAAVPSLQTLAAQFIEDADHTSTPPLPSLAEAGARIRESFAGLYWSYMRDTYWRKQRGALASYIKQLRHTAGWRHRFAKETPENPFHYDAKSDQSYWLPAP